jgi:hypothetical protein
MRLEGLRPQTGLHGSPSDATGSRERAPDDRLRIARETAHHANFASPVVQGLYIAALRDVFVSRSGKELNNIEATKPKLGKNAPGGRIVMRMSGLQFKKASISESKARHGVSCFKSIAVSPHGTIEPISQRSLALANPVNVDNANHLLAEDNGKTIRVARFPLTWMISKPPFDLLSVGRK